MTRMELAHAHDFERRAKPVAEYQRITEEQVAEFLASGWEVAGGHYHSGGELAVLVYRPLADQGKSVRG